MKLYINNERNRKINIETGEVLSKFKSSGFYRRKDLCINVKMALFIASGEGFNSTFEGEEFKEAMQIYEVSKHKI